MINRKPNAWLTSPVARKGTGRVNFVNLSADAISANDTTVDHVEFWANYNNGFSKAWRLLNTDYTAPYSYNWSISSISDQAVEFSVDVTDSKGIERKSAMQLAGNTALMLERSSGDVTNSYGSLEYPSVGELIDTSKTVTLKARAWDISSGVNRVKFWIQGSPGDSSGPNTFLGEVATAISGVYTLDVDLSGYVDSTRWVSIDIVDNNNNTVWPADLHTGIILESSPADTTNPVVTLTSPKAGDVIKTGLVTLSADPFDADSGIDHVDFWGNYDSGWHYLGSDYTEPYSTAWYANMTNSQRVLISVDVFDNAGNSVAPASITSGIVFESASKGDVFDPWCHINTPDAYTSITPLMTLSAVAGDQGSSGVDEVTFKYYWNGSWHIIGSDSTEPYECSWDVKGLHEGSVVQIRADVEDRAGNLVTSADVHSGITVYTGCDINGDGAVNAGDLIVLAQQ